MTSFSRLNPSGVIPTTSYINNPGNHIDNYHHHSHPQYLNQDHIHNPTQSLFFDLQLNHSLSDSNAHLTTELLTFNPPYSYANHSPAASLVSDVSHHSCHHPRLPITTSPLSDSSLSTSSLSSISSDFSPDQGTRFSSQSLHIPQTHFQLTYQSSSPVTMTHDQKQHSLIQLDPNCNRINKPDYKQSNHQHNCAEPTSLKPPKSPYPDSDSFKSFALSHQSKSGDNLKMQWQKSPSNEKVTIVNEEVHAKIQSPTNLVMARDHPEIIGHSRTVCGRKYREYPCQYCNKLFARPSTLVQHKRVHTGERPYKCEVENCKQTFNILSNARRHTKRHLSSIENCGSFEQE
ncbi:hypothetical protein DFH28DRAFT_533180 [Melampsora americana]|nr:hypothetical protein DFH28DRAFT_533180 [Melampsora americana]